MKNKKENIKIIEEKLHEKGVELVSLEKLKPHEEVLSESEISDLKISIMIEGLKFPIIADKRTNIILDGHSRYKIFKELGIKKIPVFFVDYKDERITLQSWRPGINKVTKEDVIRIVERGWIFPPKTTKHMFSNGKNYVHMSKIIPQIDVPIDVLCNSA